MLAIKNLVCGYDSFCLRDINMKVEEGEIVGIVGPNGAGKTTLLRTLSRVLRPIKGLVLLEGKDIWHTGVREFAQNIAVVSQGVETSSVSVEDFILLGRIPYFKRWQFLETNKDLDVAIEAMRLTDTFRLKDRPMQEISGGESQLAVIARALVQEPKLLLLDEPTAHLDIAHQVEILDLIKRLNKELGITIIMVLHDLNLASEYCQRLILINKGKIDKMGTPEDVLTYHVIEEVYKTVVVVERSPISFKPHVFVVPKEERQKKRK